MAVRERGTCWQKLSAVANGGPGPARAVGQWQPALNAFEAMAPCGVKPDAVTYGALIAASDRGNQWCRALQARSP